MPGWFIPFSWSTTSYTGSLYIHPNRNQAPILFWKSIWFGLRIGLLWSPIKSSLSPSSRLKLPFLFKVGGLCLDFHSMNTNLLGYISIRLYYFAVLAFNEIHYMKYMYAHILTFASLDITTYKCEGIIKVCITSYTLNKYMRSTCCGHVVKFNKMTNTYTTPQTVQRLIKYSQIKYSKRVAEYRCC